MFEVHFTYFTLQYGSLCIPLKLTSWNIFFPFIFLLFNYTSLILSFVVVVVYLVIPFFILQNLTEPDGIEHSSPTISPKSQGMLSLCWVIFLVQFLYCLFSGATFLVTKLCILLALNEVWYSNIFYAGRSFCYPSYCFPLMIYVFQCSLDFSIFLLKKFW